MHSTPVQQSDCTHDCDAHTVAESLVVVPEGQENDPQVGLPVASKANKERKQDSLHIFRGKPGELPDLCCHRQWQSERFPILVGPALRGKGNMRNASHIAIAQAMTNVLNPRGHKAKKNRLQSKEDTIEDKGEGRRPTPMQQSDSTQADAAQTVLEPLE